MTALLTTVPGLPTAVERRVANGQKLVVAEIAREAKCSEWAVRHYLRRAGLIGPPRAYKGPPRVCRKPEDEAEATLTPDEIKKRDDEVARRAAEIRRENMAAMAAWVYRWPDRRRYIPKVYRHPRGIVL